MKSTYSQPFILVDFLCVYNIKIVEDFDTLVNEYDEEYHNRKMTCDKNGNSKQEYDQQQNHDHKKEVDITDRII